MNIIRGMDRIALVLAIIAILPAFVLGGEIINRTFKSVTPDYEAKYKAWEKKFGKEWKEWESSGSIRMQGLGPPEPPGIEYNYPPDWQCILGGLLSAFLSFVVVLYSAWPNSLMFYKLQSVRFYCADEILLLFFFLDCFFSFTNTSKYGINGLILLT